MTKAGVGASQMERFGPAVCSSLPRKGTCVYSGIFLGGGNNLQEATVSLQRKTNLRLSCPLPSPSLLPPPLPPTTAVFFSTPHSLPTKIDCLNLAHLCHLLSADRNRFLVWGQAMHASLWILIGPNGILSLPHMSVRMQPPSSACQESRWKLHGSLLSAFVPLSVLNISWENLCARKKQTLCFSARLLHFSEGPLSLCQTSKSMLSCHDSDSREECSGKTGTPDLSEIATETFTLYTFLLCPFLSLRQDLKLYRRILIN